MSWFVWLIPIALGMGVVGLMAFLWSLKGGQFEDLDGAAVRVLLVSEEDQPLPSSQNKAERDKKRRAKLFTAKLHNQLAKNVNLLDDKDHNHD